MGQELPCTARLGKQESSGRAQLETDYLLFRGDFRVRIPFASMKSVTPRDGRLEIKSPEATLSLDIGKYAEKWAEKILHPPSRLDKLGIKQGTRVAIVSLKDPSIEAELTARGAEISRNPDVLLFGVEKKAGLDRFAKLKAPAIWIVYPKGVKAITEMDVIGAIRAAGLVDVKVASFSATHTALKAVPPKSK
ncbi:MAG: hypothetical protein LAO79_16100 [Acidobacteriia bacterium]|nr:hypothetical protein [Terriglobia bacterium]